MKLIIFLFGVALVVADDSKSNLEKTFKQGNEVFTKEFFQEVAAENPEKSVVMSAFSLLQPLAQLALGSVGESKDEILKKIGIPNDNVTKAVFPLVNGKLKSIKGITLKMANKLYVAEGQKLQDSFLKASKDAFESEVQSIDFSKSSPAAKTINDWVEDNTNKKIKDLITSDSIDSTTGVVLVNAIYFKGAWKEKYNAALTKDSDFHVSKDKTIKVPTMYKKADFRYGESADLDAKLLEIPYEGEESSLLIVLPNKIDGLQDLLKKLKNPTALEEAEHNMYKTEIETYIPKFKIETTIDLKTVLFKMGIKKMFTSQANLKNLLENGDLQVSSAKQKAFIEINEEGAEAAAANEFQLHRPSPPGFHQVLIYKADHPFVFCLKLKKTELFRGIFRH